MKEKLNAIKQVQDIRKISRKFLKIERKGQRNVKRRESKQRLN